METEGEDKPWHDGLTDKQRRFVEEYVIDCNGRQAAIRAGYSEESAASIASENLTKPNVLAAKERLLEQKSLTALEALKQTSDIARTRLNDFIRIEKVLRVPKVRKLLPELIAELRYLNRLDQDFIERADLPKKEEDEVYGEKQKRDLQILRYQIELEHNPDAYRDVPGEGVWVDEAVPDLVALARANEQGRIKSLAFTQHGPKIELYPADAALNKILEVYGKVKGPGEVTVNVAITPEDVKTFRAEAEKKY